MSDKIPDLPMLWRFYVAPPLLRVGTRGSPMAIAQTQRVCAHLASRYAELATPQAIELVTIRTTGDAVQDRTLAEIGGKELFTKEIEEALYRRKIDFAVHSLKDVPTFLPQSLMIACVLERDDPRDAWLARDGHKLSQLPSGAVVGTASLRRQAQILNLRPDIRVEPIRGNAGTRMKKLASAEVDATLLAISGLRRLGEEHMATQILSVEDFLPSVAQGAIAVECREEDEHTRAYLEPLEHAASRLCVDTERAFLAALDGSCRTPIAGFAEIVEDGVIRFLGLVAKPDGSKVWRIERRSAPEDAVRMGENAGNELAAEIGSVLDLLRYGADVLD